MTAPTRAALVSNPDYVIPHDPSELTIVEVWEKISTGEYFIWDTHNNELSYLDHWGHHDFMDAALAAEDDIIADANPVRQALLRASVAANLNRRRRTSRGRSQALSSIP